MATGWIIVFEGQGRLVDERHPSALIHRTREQAEAALNRGDQVGKPLSLLEINWDDSKAQRPWPP
ncbi:MULTISPECIES: hypothetical protein [unclassified Bradyrhizobium]|uniref:hypothetical protein n=1 Tax=unclassified Bradyrhizobium TaxID=2631580 RepID=UPI0028EEF96F|nr:MULTISPECIES: hypothetical protein [unclassified Bradyrhizobium]